MKFTLTAAICCFSFSVLSHAASVASSNVGVSPIDSLAIAYSGSTTGASGGIVTAGYFRTYSDAQVANLAMDLTNLAALINDFEVVASGTLDGAFGGLLVGSGLYDFSAGSLTFPNSTRAGSGLYTFAGNNSSLATSNQVLLWDHTAIIDPEDSIASPDSNALLLAEDGSILIGGGFVSIDVDFGPLGGPVTPISAVQLQLIPEPSAFILGAIGALGLLRRRR